MADAMRAMLDELMGSDRNLPPEEQNKPKPPRRLDDSKLCKNYLCGFCPAEEFQRTKHDFGPCPSDHDSTAKKQWEALPDEERDRWGYERDLLSNLEGMRDDLQRKITRNESRLKQQSIPVLVSSEQANLTAMATRIADLVRESEKLGEEGDVDASQAAAQQAETLKAQKARTETEAASRAVGGGPSRPGTTQYVCPTSAVIVDNSETRIKDHLSGRNYKSWVRAHEALKQLKETVDARGARPRPREREREVPRPSTRREDDRPRERERDRERDRDRDRDRDRERDRDSRGNGGRDKERGSHRSREMDQRERDRDGRDGGRERDRDRRDTGSRHRERDRDSDRSYDRR